MAFETILFEVNEGVALVTLNRPDKLNAFIEQMNTDIRTAVKQVAADPAIRCLMFTGAGRGFCAGADLSARALTLTDEGELDLGYTLRKNYHPMMLALAELEKPIVTAVNGPCAGAGMSLAIAADIVVAARSATFLQAFCNIGLVPDAGSTWFLPRQIGRARAAGMALLGEKLSAETAAEWGLIWKCVADDQLMAEAGAVARKLAGGPTKGLSLIRRALRQSWDNDLAQQLELEADLQRVAGRTRDFAEGVTAFMQKRPAKFQGK